MSTKYGVLKGKKNFFPWIDFPTRLDYCVLSTEYRYWLLFWRIAVPGVNLFTDLHMLAACANVVEEYFSSNQDRAL